MQPVLSREQMRRFDQQAIRDWHVPSLLLMENAGRGAADLIAERAAPDAGLVLVLAGGGNNGGDGMVVARRLLTLGYDVLLALLSDPAKLSGDAAINWRALAGVGGQSQVFATCSAELASLIARARVLVDALFGTGLDRPLDGRYKDVVDLMNRAPGQRVALDIPSGLDCDTGRVMGIAVKAQHTVTFGYPKLGLLTPCGLDHSGELQVVDIGVPSGGAIEASAHAVESRDVEALLVPRAASMHKARAGRVMVLAGSAGTSGAALLSARSALRAGAGLVTIVNFPDAIATIEPRVLEVMTRSLDPGAIAESVQSALAGADAVVVGPGFGMDARAREAVRVAVFESRIPVILDADGISHFAGQPEALRQAKAALVLTPHPGELARLLSTTASQVEADRFAALDSAVTRSGATVLLKGAHSLIGAPGSTPMINTSGSPVLAVAGAGDVLSGITAALATQLAPRDAAYAAAHIHGLAAERWRATHGDRGMLAGEIADGVPEVIAELAARSQVLPT